ncbi:hypothetical protein [Microbacterium sp.]|uniref:hypothetical protein n=1 Tax=Microbacterium sp. TaxID=51671 RepID=UPI00281174E5|nr:hypothetical protein [Microbacterium sp.]
MRLSIYLSISLPLLAVVGLLRSSDVRHERIDPTFSESLARSSLAIPKRFQDGDGILGIIGGGEARGCHFIAWEYEGNVSVMVVARWWPYRVRDLKDFSRVSEWRRWAETVDARVLEDGPYAGAVFAKYFEENFKILDDREHDYG